MKISEAEIPSLLFDEQAADPATPAAGFWRVYAKATGLFLIDDAGVVLGPFGSSVDLAAHLSDATAAHAASAISYAGGTGIVATDVEAAIDELATEKADLASPTFTGLPVAPQWKATGVTGASTTPLTLSGANASGSPASGAHVKGEIAGDDTGKLWYCTVAGTPGTWVDVGGAAGGSVVHNYKGKTSSGASFLTPTVNRWYMKKITLAADGMLTSIGARINFSAGAVANSAAAVFSDASGVPDLVLAWGGYPPGSNTVNAVISSARWVHHSIGLWCTAGDYWISWSAPTDIGNIQIGYDTTGGADRHFTAAGGWVEDPALRTITTTTEDYDIRASVLT